MMIRYIFLFLATLICLNAQVQAQTEKSKVIAHAVDSFNVSMEYDDIKIKLYVVSKDTKTFNRIYGYVWYNGKEEKHIVDVLEFDPDINKILVLDRNNKNSILSITPSPKIETYLRGKNIDGIKMAEDCNITITSALINSEANIHATDTIIFRPNDLDGKLYVVSTNGDTKTFNRIFGYYYQVEDLEWKKIIVDLIQYDSKNNIMILSMRNRNNLLMKKPSPKIEAFLRGKGKSQKGETVTMAEDCNITIEKKE